MVKRLSDMPEVEAHHLRRIECPTFDDTPALPGKPLAQRRVALISTAGLHRRGDRPFRPGDVRHSQADIGKAASLLGYMPTHDVARGLKLSIRWYGEHLAP